MLRLSKLADYGTLVMVYLARQGDQLATAQHIASQIHVNLPTVTKLLKILTHHHLLTSSRGAKGGYLLARDANHITLGEIVRALEHKPSLTECSDEQGLCALEPICVMRAPWQRINNIVQTTLNNITLAEISNPDMPNFGSEKV